MSLLLSSHQTAVGSRMQMQRKEKSICNKYGRREKKSLLKKEAVKMCCQRLVLEPSLMLWLCIRISRTTFLT